MKQHPTSSSNSILKINRFFCQVSTKVVCVNINNHLYKV
jgi:hypothetical protein